MNNRTIITKVNFSVNLIKQKYFRDYESIRKEIEESFLISFPFNKITPQLKVLFDNVVEDIKTKIIDIYNTVSIDDEEDDSEETDKEEIEIPRHTFHSFTFKASIDAVSGKDTSKVTKLALNRLSVYATAFFDTFSGERKVVINTRSEEPIIIYVRSANTVAMKSSFKWSEFQTLAQNIKVFKSLFYDTDQANMYNILRLYKKSDDVIIYLDDHPITDFQIYKADEKNGSHFFIGVTDSFYQSPLLKKESKFSDCTKILFEKISITENKKEKLTKISIRDVEHSSRHFFTTTYSL